MIQIAKCNDCGVSLEVSREGWLVDGVVRNKLGNPVFTAKGVVKREQRYTEWIHIPGHMRGKKQCPGSGASPAKLPT